MAEIVNLNRYRKSKVRGAASQQAADNRVKFGRRKGERLDDDLARKRAERELDGKKLEKPDEPEPA